MRSRRRRQKESSIGWTWTYWEFVSFFSLPGRHALGCQLMAYIRSKRWDMVRLIIAQHWEKRLVVFLEQWNPIDGAEYPLISWLQRRVLLLPSLLPFKDVSRWMLNPEIHFDQGFSRWRWLDHDASKTTLTFIMQLIDVSWASTGLSLILVGTEHWTSSKISRTAKLKTRFSWRPCQSPERDFGRVITAGCAVQGARLG